MILGSSPEHCQDNQEECRFKDIILFVIILNLIDVLPYSKSELPLLGYS